MFFLQGWLWLLIILEGWYAVKQRNQNEISWILDVHYLKFPVVCTMIRWKEEKSWHGISSKRFLVSIIIIFLFFYLLCHYRIIPVGLGCRIHQLHLCRGVNMLPPSMSILDMTLNYLMLRLQSWSSGKCGVPLHCHYSQVHSDLEWWYLLGSHLLIK